MADTYRCPECGNTEIEWGYGRAESEGVPPVDAAPPNPIPLPFSGPTRTPGLSGPRARCSAVARSPMPAPTLGHIVSCGLFRTRCCSSATVRTGSPPPALGGRARTVGLHRRGTRQRSGRCPPAAKSRGLSSGYDLERRGNVQAALGARARNQREQQPNLLGRQRRQGDRNRVCVVRPPLQRRFHLQKPR